MQLADFPDVLNEQQYQELSQYLFTMMRRQGDTEQADLLEATQEMLVEWRAQGCYIYDPQGQAYLDAVTAGGVFALGHANPRLIEAMVKQLHRGGLSIRGGIVPLQLEVIDRLSQLTPPGLQNGLLATTGTDAMEIALKLAHLVTKRTEFVGMDLGYHGMSYGTLSVSGIPYWKKNFAPMLEGSTTIPYNNLEAALAAISDKTAAVVIEPVQWASGCRVASKEYLEALRAHCDKVGALLIFDEIQSGLARTGRWFACEYSGVTPDILSVGKTLSGGLVPIAALMFNDRVQQAALAHKEINSSTFSGNPLSCAVALEVLNILTEENMPQRVQALGEKLAKRLDDFIGNKYSDVLNGQLGLGLMRCINTTTPQFGFMTSLFMMKDYNVILPALSHCPTLMRFSPPFTISDEEFAYLMDSLDKALAKVQNMGLAGFKKYIDECMADLKAKQEAFAQAHKK